ncbi:Type II inositol 1,4,5-trisphosphate 5-phosphatase [Linderina macrospora]|uniref:Type II inositol 1,4,5-trisphosphate 5-phosphatase n=1 Tax=Linderina macrospora TaxID=4868 RepID=A0ACC1JBP5_9FUNG|nr:Type II inositol 1,4,5-trisphosphate 5-phosphatase [Linderina macrospora]
MRIGTVTYNLAQRRPSETALRELVQGAGAAELFIVAVQEHSDFLEAMRCRSTPQYTDNFAHILSALDAALRSSARRIATVEHGAQGLAIYHQTSSRTDISLLSTNKVSTGPYLTSSKGGVGVLLRIHASDGEPTTLAVVGAHLAAGMENVGRRNAHFRDMVSRLALAGMSLLHADAAVFLGDLNYRSMDGKLANDQLRREMEANRVLPAFAESAIAFGPTYRLVVGEKRLYDNLRTPAWCDRALVYVRSPAADVAVRRWWAGELSADSERKDSKGLVEAECPVDWRRYEALEVCGSDHRPVVAEFDLHLPVAARLSAMSGDLPHMVDPHWPLWLSLGEATGCLAGEAYHLAANPLPRTVCLSLFAAAAAYYIYSSKPQ